MATYTLRFLGVMGGEDPRGATNSNRRRRCRDLRGRAARTLGAPRPPIDGDDAGMWRLQTMVTAPHHAGRPVSAAQRAGPPRLCPNGALVAGARFLMWPLFSADDVYAPFLATLVIALNIVKVTLIGLGVVKDDGVVNSMTRNGDHRELLKGPLYYACAITLTTIIFWRTSPISIAVICNLCAGDGVADIAGRRFGHKKLPYNPDKSYAGTIAMFSAGFVASILYMCYFHLFGFVEQSWIMVVAFGITSLAAAIVESLQISTRLDDNLTTPIASVLVGGLVFNYVGGGGATVGDRSSIAAIAEMVFAGSS